MDLEEWQVSFAINTWIAKKHIFLPKHLNGDISGKFNVYYTRFAFLDTTLQAVNEYDIKNTLTSWRYFFNGPWRVTSFFCN